MRADSVQSRLVSILLAPLHLDLLGLVMLEPSPPTIAGQTGPGMLGKLFCGLANALNPQGATLSRIAAALNSLFAALRLSSLFCRGGSR